MLDIPERESFSRRWAAVLVGAAGAIAIAGCAWWFLALLLQDDTAAERPVISAIDRGDVTRTVAAYGKLLPRESTMIQARVEGTVEKVIKRPGATIGPGEPIVLLANVELTRRIEDARADLLEARANVELTKARIEREMLKARSDRKLAESDAELASRKAEMMSLLLEQNSISRLEFMQAQMDETRAILRKELAIQSLEVMQRTAEAELSASELRRRSAQRALESARADRERLTVKSDQSGLLTVLNDEVKIGAFVQRGQVLGQVAAPESLYAELFVSASDAELLASGQPAELSVQGRRIPARVTRVDPSVADGQVRVIADLVEATGQSLRANVDVSARFAVAQAAEAIRIKRPTHVAASDDQFDAFVENGKYLERQTLPLGVVGDDYMQILADLAPGTRIAIAYPERWADRHRISLEDL